MSALKYVQTPTFYQAGGGSIIGATSVVLTSFTDIYGNVLTMTDFGGEGYGTCEPDTNNEEAFTFTGVTANANGTYSLTGVKTALAKSPYTETSALIRQHAGGTKVVITDNVAFWNTFTNKNNDETVNGQWTFTNTPIVPGTVSDASTTVKGVSKLSVAAALSTNPIVVGTNDPRVPVAYAVDSVGTDSYAITPSPAITAYVAGQIFTFQAGTANTGAATLNVSALGAKTIKKLVSSDLVTGDILANQIVSVIYDGTNMQIINPDMINASSQISGTIPVANLPIPAFYQVLSSGLTNSSAASNMMSGSNTDGSVIYINEEQSGGQTWLLQRLARDTKTGMYQRTHFFVPSMNSYSTGTIGNIIQIGTFIYVFYVGSTNIQCERYLAADLTGETIMTVPTVPGTEVVAWTDGTDAYVISDSSSTTSRKWTLSGTTFVASTTATCVSNLVQNTGETTLFDGTNIYLLINSNASSIIYKLANVMATALTSTTTILNSNSGVYYSDVPAGAILTPIGTDRIYIGIWSKVYNQTAQYTALIQLLPFTKP